MTDEAKAKERDGPVTKEMISEGVRVYLEHCPDIGVGDQIDRQMVEEIYRAMALVKAREAPSRPI